MQEKKEQSPERDSQLWIHQNGIHTQFSFFLGARCLFFHIMIIGFLTNKATGLVLDVDRSGTFMGRKESLIKLLLQTALK